MKIVLYFQPVSEKCSPAKLGGVRSIAAKAGYHVQVVDSEPTAKNVARLIELWQPLGAIVDCGNRTGEVPAKAFDKLPTVFLCRNPKTLRTSDFAVYHDNAATARAAAKELMMSGLASYAVVKTEMHQDWSEARAEAFIEALALNGREVAVFDAKGRKRRSHQHELRKFLAALPRPAGVFAVCDEVASETVAAARFAGLNVPEHVAVVGVDNYADICENLVPTLSSVEPDFLRGGQLAMLMLIARLREKGAFRGERQRAFGPSRVVRRASSRLACMPGARCVGAMLERIRREACSGITAAEVAAMMPASRPVVDARFKAIAGRSILEEIHAVQLERVKELLRDPGRELKSLDAFCGFTNANSLRKFFLRETGMTMTAWRKEQLML